MTILHIDLDSKLVTVTGIMAIRELVSVELDNIGGSDPSNLILALSNGDTVLASCHGFTAVGPAAVGILDLSLIGVVGLFDINDDPQGKFNLFLTVWDSYLNSMRVNTSIPIFNNVFSQTLPQPS